MNTQVVAQQNSSDRLPVWLALTVSSLRKAAARFGSMANVMRAAMENSRAAQAAQFIDAHSHLFTE